MYEYAACRSACGGGVVSVELRPSFWSDEPDADGETESWSLWKSRAESGGLGASILFIATSTDAASSN